MREEAKTIVAMTKEIYSKLPSNEADRLTVELDEKVWRVFGVSPRRNQRVAESGKKLVWFRQLT